MRSMRAFLLATLLAAANMAAAQTEIADAAMNGDSEAVQSLLQEGFDVNARQADGATALHWAVYHRDAGLASLLIDAGADTSAANRNGSTPMWLASSQGDDLAAQAIEVRGIKVLAASLEGADARTLRETMDKLKDKLKSAVIVLGAVEGGKVQLAAGVTADATGRVKAGDLVNYVAQQVGGKGGGRPDMAMAGGTDPSKLAPALASVQAWAEQRL